MFVQSFLLATLVALQVATCKTLQNEKIEPVDLNYLCIEAAKKGDKNLSPVLLIHGLSGSISNWKGVHQVLALETGRKVCAVDLRNHGESPWSDKADVRTMTEDINNFLKLLNIDKVNIIGHSLGGKLAVNYAFTYPEQVQSIVVEDMRPNGASENATNQVKGYLHIIKEALNQVPEGSDEDTAKKHIIDYLRETMKEWGITEEIFEEFENLGDIVPIRCKDGKWQYTFNIDVFLKSLEDIDNFFGVNEGVFEKPALFIYGKISPFDIPGDRENILKLFPNAELVGVEGANHMVHGLFREFDDEVVKFLSKMNS